LAFNIFHKINHFDFAAKATADAQNPKVEEWEQLMWTFQQPLPFAVPGEKWMLMKKIFTLS
jgi:L-rhamnose mutarotase